jgi:hypothetical protein
MITNRLAVFFLILFSTVALADGPMERTQEERIKFWKEYYNPKVEVTQDKAPEIKITLHKVGPFFQLQSQIKNFKFTPERDMKDNNARTGYGKLYINKNFITRVYNERLFLKSIPEGDNEIKVILSSNMDHDVAKNGELISDQIYMRFPEYNFSEARAHAHGLFTQCEFSNEGQIRTKKLASMGLKASESSEYLKCTYDSNKSIDSFTNEMSKIQRAHYEIVNTTLENRISLWKSYEMNEINLSDARKKDLELVNGIETKMEQMACALNSRATYSANGCK